MDEDVELLYKSLNKLDEWFNPWVVLINGKANLQFVFYFNNSYDDAFIRRSIMCSLTSRLSTSRFGYDEVARLEKAGVIQLMKITHSDNTDHEPKLLPY